MAVSDDVPLTAFTYELYHCLSAIGKCHGGDISAHATGSHQALLDIEKYV